MVAASGLVWNSATTRATMAIPALNATVMRSGQRLFTREL
jgi:hypothetical protein